VGSTGQSARFTVDDKGRVTSANSIAISIASGAVTGLANSATTDTTNADNITSGTLNRDRLPVTGVAAISFGGQAVVPRYTLDATGRITSANNIAIAINAGAVTGLAGVATSGSYNIICCVSCRFGLFKCFKQCRSIHTLRFWNLGSHCQ
jgi:ABC-type uncharacterized transport system ATPase subunit